MNEEEAYGKLAKGVLRFNIISIILGVIIGKLSTVINGFIVFWISIHTIPYAVYKKQSIKRVF